jgi:hypothetical protein
VGAHAGKKSKDKLCKQRYWSDGHRVKNKIRRITRCNGAAFLEAWKAKYAR